MSDENQMRQEIEFLRKRYNEEQSSKVEAKREAESAKKKLEKAQSIAEWGIKMAEKMAAVFLATSYGKPSDAYHGLRKAIDEKRQELEETRSKNINNKGAQDE